MADGVVGSRPPDVVVIGGGIIGAAVARELARGGVAVTVLERDRPGSHASWAAAGMLSPLAEAEEPGPFLDLLLAARERFPALAAELREETSVDVGYLDTGTLFLSLRPGDDAALERRHGWQREAGLAVERLTAGEIRELEPGVSPQLRWGLRFPGDHQVESRSLTRALWISARNAGAELRTGVRVSAVEHGSGSVRGVRLEDGSRIDCGRVVVAAGCWSGRLGGLPRPLPVRPVHGQLVSLQAPLPLLRHVVDSPRCYLVPRADGRLIIGTTVEDTGFRTETTAGALRGLLNAAAEAAPAADGLVPGAPWSGLRPGTPDGLPILGPDPEVEGIVYATGHYRNGILLAPITGELVARACRDEAVPEFEPFDVGRFAA
jgi:glycine oxidase